VRVRIRSIIFSTRNIFIGAVRQRTVGSEPVVGRNRPVPRASSYPKTDQSAGLMKIVFVTEINPFPPFGGSELRAFNLLKALQSFASVHFVLLKSAAHRHIVIDSELKDTFNLASFTCLEFSDSPGSGLLGRVLTQQRVLAELKKINSAIAPDIVFLDYAYIAHYRSAFPNSKIVVGSHNVQSEIDRQIAELPNRLPAKIYANLVWRASQYHERVLFPKGDAIIAVSQEDLAYYEKYIDPRKLWMVPNFIDLNGYSPGEEIAEKRRPRIVFSGSMDAFQNQQAGEYFLRDIWPRIAEALPECDLFIVGKNPPQTWRDSADERIHVTGKVPSVIAFLQSADVSVVPLLHGSGTRLKILEAMACHVPVVSTSLGAQGIDGQTGHDIFIKNDPQGFADSVIQILKSPEDKRWLAQNGYHLVKQKYSLEANQSKIHQLCQELVAS
jgi:polysaccharide biosynthesis protein PslH